ncbi:MAG: hypothetical protein RQ899_04185 [Pseudomonadales bacterium]|nr:hypothetical protein [Pseudomonadales bacterium]
MTSSLSLDLHIGNAIPHGNAAESAAIITLWQGLQDYFVQQAFTAQGSINGKAQSWLITLDSSRLLQALENAAVLAGGFDAYREAHVRDEEKSLAAVLNLDIACKDGTVSEVEAYQVATVFIQQIILAANIALPGSLQILDARFSGAGAHRFEAQTFDSIVFYGALKCARHGQGPALRTPAFDDVWQWLQTCEVSTTHTAIKSINKVLFTLLKVAEQRHEYSARTVLLVLYQLEVLLACRHAPAPDHIRQRTRLVLGSIPESADCFKELYEVRNSLFLGDQPVHRPPLISHGSGDELKARIGQHNTAVELGTALVLALLQDLLSHGQQDFAFKEILLRP